MRWNHARKGIIEGEIVRDLGEFVDIELMNKVRIGHGSPMMGTGFRSVYAGPGQIIKVRKSFLQPLEEKGGGR